ncbi:hypothetical protein [Xanthomonas campestris]|nr:hypothetical protein [Xanthomonas campestris]MCC4603860.1 hypothetical protein [Xanthomonas campestris pv. parthenii]
MNKRMKRFRHSSGLLVALVLSNPLSARAAASMVVDDASVTPRGQCQLEAWSRAMPATASSTLVPACNVAGTEIALGLTDIRHGTTSMDLGAKRVLRDPEQHVLGVALSMGVQRSWQGSQQRAGYITLPLTWSFGDAEATRLHVNAGVTATYAGPDTTNAGIGIEHAATASWTLLGEAFGDDHQGQGAQAGVRRMVGKASSIDLLVGRDRLNAPRGWITLGINLAMAP